ncbi:DUF4148 domain-containing protein [Paraburkholderia solisilvae]|uniref:DUF4148 domain-containing protein n=1 Tax=Paraburkholderia solisilvae TaxID=624376 RepID=A0A6J5DF92_9BURK|nr:DUF4148 domain-containing protein [Paraburkholderia solisilvae]CAB3751822.1 hypothetical protein LMG29739_01390 [Paraburkholderia solisilvae]
MKSLIKAVAIAALLAAPVVSFAQASQSTVTRAQVRQELIQLEKAGYNPALSNDTTYPEDIQAAERRVQAANAAQNQGVARQPSAPSADTGYGAATGGNSQAGAPIQLNRGNSVDYGH